jgi:hypothetical protein
LKAGPPERGGARKKTERELYAKSMAYMPYMLNLKTVKIVEFTVFAEKKSLNNRHLSGCNSA